MSASSLYQPTMIDVLWPAEVRSRWLRAAVLAVAGSLNNLAGLYQKDGRYDLAERLLRRAIVISVAVAGR